MSKELEALKRIEKLVIDRHGYGKDYIEEISILEQALTPPTQEEVCEALSEYFGCKVNFELVEYEEIETSSYRPTFYYEKVKKDYHDNKYIQKKIIVIGDKNGVTVNSYLPPHLITMIAKFYQGKSEPK